MVRLLRRHVQAWWWRGPTVMRVRGRGVEVGRGTRFVGMPIIGLVPRSRVAVGRRCVMCSLSEETALGVHHAIVLRTLQEGATIVIGDDVGISGGSICAAVRVEIGSRSMLGANVTIVDTDFHPIAAVGRREATGFSDVQCAPVAIGENVFLGSGVIVLKGVTIGANTVVGAGSVVARSLGPNVIAAGNPARVVRQLEGDTAL